MTGGASDTMGKEHVVDGTSMRNFKERMQRLQQDVLDQFANRLNEMVTDVVEELENIAHTGGAQPTQAARLYMDKKKIAGSGKLPEKHFQTRNSVLTDVMNDVRHLKPIYNLWLIILSALFLHTMMSDLVETGRLNLGCITMASGLGKFTEVIRIWCLMMTSCFGLYAFHSFWANRHIKLKPNSINVKIWDRTWLLLFVGFQLSFLWIPARAVLAAALPPGSALIVIMEQVRLMMKTHAFIRSTWTRVAQYKPHTEGKELAFPGFSQFLYFMFAPTLIYRDVYPRTRRISWNFVFWYSLEVICVCFFIAFVTEKYIFPTYKNYGVEQETLRTALQKIFSSILPAGGIYLSGFYLLLHSWMNAWAELLKFGDRVYYKDWWNAESYGSFYRNWNVVVHDWLYTYIYKDSYEILFPGSRVIATTAVFLISGVFHEYIVSIGFHLFYPMMFVMFVLIGCPLIWLMPKNSYAFGNVFVLFSLMFGNGILLSTYAMEYFARANCPSFGDDILDVVLPRSWLCNSTELMAQ